MANREGTSAWALLGQGTLSRCHALRVHDFNHEHAEELRESCKADSGTYEKM